MLNKILNVPLPRLIPIKQKFIRTEIHDIPGEVIRLYRTSSQRTVVKHGDRIAIAVGSRGIFGIDQIIRALIIELKDQGASPFIIPAMGSHGGATAEGQIEVLAGLGTVSY